MCRGSHEAYLPFGIQSLLNTVPKVLTMEVCIFSRCYLSFFPEQRSFPLESLEPELDKLCLALSCHKAESMNAPTIHMPVRSHRSVTTHSPKKRVQGAWLLAEEVPRSVVCRCRLWNFSIRHWFDSMYQVWEFDGILNKENRNVIPNNICTGVSKAVQGS